MTVGAPPPYGDRLASSDRPGGPSTSRGDAPTWRALLAIPIALVAVFAGMVAFMIATGIRDALVTAPVQLPGDAGVAAHGDPPVLTLVSTFFQDLALIIGVGLAVAAALGGRLRAAALGLRPPAKVAQSAGLVVGAYVLFLIVTGLWTSLLGIDERENVAVQFGTRDSTAALVGAMLLICAVAPIAEELFFRGFLFGALRKYGLVVAAGVTGVLFGLAHVLSSPIGFIVPLAFLGVLLCLLYERTGSLYPPIALHCINNSIAFAVGDGRGWLVLVCLVAAGTTIVVVLRTIVRAFPAPAG